MITFWTIYLMIGFYLAFMIYCALEDEGVKHVYQEGPGIHDMNFWQEWAGKFIPEAFKD